MCSYLMIFFLMAAPAASDPPGDSGGDEWSVSLRSTGGELAGPFEKVADPVRAVEQAVLAV